MFPEANNGLAPNNNLFSLASVQKCVCFAHSSHIVDFISSITAVIADKGGCFVPPNKAYCGNDLVENGEECDCGCLQETIAIRYNSLC